VRPLNAIVSRHQVSDVNTIALVVVGAGILILIVIRKSRIGARYRNASELEGSLVQRVGAKYFRDRSWSEIVVLVGAPILWVAIIYVWGWWHGW
jgi:hypothetical protein